MVLLGKGDQVEAQFDMFGDRANLDPRYDARFAWNLPYAQQSIWMHPMEILDDVCHMKSRFGLFGDSVSFSARQVKGLKKQFWTHLMVLIGEGMEAQFGLFGDIANLDARQVHSLHGTYHML